jgi:hypothetical protein
MHYIANTNEYVIYNGDLSHAIDDITKDLMRKELIEGNKYLVIGYEHDGYYENHYKIRLNCSRVFTDFTVGGRYGYFPVKSFDVLYQRDFIINKYNLK